MNGSGRSDGTRPKKESVLPGVTHYDINVAPSLPAAVIPFLDEHPASAPPEAP